MSHSKDQHASRPDPNHENTLKPDLPARTGEAAVLADALVAGALPGELVGFTEEDRTAAAALGWQAIAQRRPAHPEIVTETVSRSDGDRVMRLAIANDDMPFLVDSVAAAIAQAGLAIHRLLHPVLTIVRDADAVRIAATDGVANGGAHDPRADVRKTRESLIYLEVDRTDARARRALVEAIERALHDVRLAVRDWPAMRDALDHDAREQAEKAKGGEGGGLLPWFAQGRLTLLGRATFGAGDRMTSALGIMSDAGEDKAAVDALLGPTGRKAARAWLDTNPGPLLIKASVCARVHRHAPIDLILYYGEPESGGERPLVIVAALWTSAALATDAETMPILGPGLKSLAERYGFDPAGHAGKALAHALTTLPHDILLAIEPSRVDELALTAMSIADRPRPRLVLASDRLDRQIFAFVWLPRDEWTTARRVAITQLLTDAIEGDLLNWAVQMGDGNVALLRFSFDRRNSTRSPDSAALDQQIASMVRGWDRSVEVSLAEHNDAGRAARLAMRYAHAFPIAYRDGAGAEEAARDIARLHALHSDAERGVRLYVNPGDAPGRVRLKLYARVPITLSDAVPALENFGFRVIEEVATTLAGEGLGHIHRFILDLAEGEAAPLLARGEEVEVAIAEVIAGAAENDPFNQLVVTAEMRPRDALLFRALFRYLRQTGLAYGVGTVAAALRSESALARKLVELFHLRHDPSISPAGHPGEDVEAAITAGFARVVSVDNDRILRRLLALVRATLRTNFFAPQAQEAIAFKLDSHAVPGLPAPVPWREIWVYSPRVEGIHLRAGPVARGGLRWSDRRDDFRTEILGLMKAQRVKNAVIVPTGAKGGFYPKQLPDSRQRDAWMAEGTEAYRIFIRSLLSLTDNLVEGQVVHPDQVVIHDGDDPYFVVAADKGTASFSDVANAIALERGFWLGDAFASGGSVGYDHKAMGITAKGGWISVRRHFAEQGVDIQTQPVRVVGCGDMSGDVFGNGMLLSKAVKLVAAFDHRHIFLDPDPDPAASWGERARLFALPRSSWADYDPALISPGGGVFPRDAKTIALTDAVRAVLGIEESELEPSALITRILTAPVDLIWFGGIGTYIKAASEANSSVGDPANDAQRVDAEQLRAKVVGEGANLGVTQAARIAFSLRGGRINTDFIDNSAGVDCSDNEVNIKIALNAEVTAGALALDARNALLASMTDDVSHLVLEDNRLQTLALSIAERGGREAIPAQIALIESFEAADRLDRAVEGLPANDVLLRRVQDGAGLTRPELAVLMATAKIALQDAIEHSSVAQDPATLTDLLEAFPRAMRERHRAAIEGHRLRGEIVATKMANRMVNRLGMLHPFELAEEENATLGNCAGAFAIVERLYDLDALWAEIDGAEMTESARIMLFEQIALEVRAQMADSLRNSVPGRSIDAAVAALRPCIQRLGTALDQLLQAEPRAQAQAFTRKLIDGGAPEALAGKVVGIAELDGAIGISALAVRTGGDPITITHAYADLGSALGLDWAQGAAMALMPSDPWERLLIAGLGRDFQQMRLDFLEQAGADPRARVSQWLTANGEGVASFRRLIDRARRLGQPSTAMLAQIAGQARALLSRRPG